MRSLTSESTLTAAVAKRGRSLGFKVWTINQTRKKPRFQMDKGLPDIMMVGHGTILFVETKVGANGLSEEQKEFQAAVAPIPVCSYWVVYDIEDFQSRCYAHGWCKVTL